MYKNMFLHFVHVVSDGKMFKELLLYTSFNTNTHLFVLLLFEDMVCNFMVKYWVHLGATLISGASFC